MRRIKRESWWGLYGLVPLTVLLLCLAYLAKASQGLQNVLIGAIAVLISILALLWSERHADLMHSNGVDSLTGEHALRAVRITNPRLAPSLTAGRAQIHSILLAVAVDEFQDDPASFKQST
jgi:hypothetical protein